MSYRDITHRIEWDHVMNTTEFPPFLLTSSSNWLKLLKGPSDCLVIGRLLFNWHTLLPAHAKEINSRKVYIFNSTSPAPMPLTSQMSKWYTVSAARCSRFYLLHCCSRSAATFRLSRIWERKPAIKLSPELWWICSGDCWETDPGISSCQSTGLCLTTL